MANMTRYNPFNDFVSLRKVIDRLFDDSVITPRTMSAFFNRALPANLYEPAEGFTLQGPMFSVNPENAEIDILQDVVSLKWQTGVEIPENATVHYYGFQKSEYQRSFTVPLPIDYEGTEASYKDGILTLRLPEVEHARARTIKVNAANN